MTTWTTPKVNGSESNKNPIYWICQHGNSVNVLRIAQIFIPIYINEEKSFQEDTLNSYLSSWLYGKFSSQKSSNKNGLSREHGSSVLVCVMNRRKIAWKLFCVARTIQTANARKHKIKCKMRRSTMTTYNMRQKWIGWKEHSKKRPETTAYGMNNTANRNENNKKCTSISIKCNICVYVRVNK